MTIEVSRLFRHWEPMGPRRGVSGRYQTGQAHSFVAALANAGTLQPEAQGYTAVDAATVACDPTEYQWLQEPGLGGLYRLTRMGVATSATFLVNRELPLEDKVQTLEAMTWVPQPFLGSLIEATRKDKLPKLYRPDLPSGRVNQPLLQMHLQVLLGDTPASQPVSRYLWPSLSDGELSLDPGEEVHSSWIAASVRLASFSDGMDLSGIGKDGTPDGSSQPRVYLTNRRLVVIARRDPAKVTGDGSRRWWGVHFRYEWVSEIGLFDLTTFKRSGILAKPTGHETSIAPYARLALPSGKPMEVSFPGLAPSVGDPFAGLSELVPKSSPSRLLAGDGSWTAGSTFSNWTRHYRLISGAVPYSLPLSLTSTVS